MFPRPGRWREIPSVEKYFLGPNRDLVVSRFAFRPSPDTSYRRLGPHLFTTGESAVLIRHATERELALLERGSFRRIAYLLDDDLDAIAGDPAINADYRRRVAAFRDGPLQRILRRATDFIAPSIPLLSAHSGPALHFLGPALTHTPPGTTHFATEETFRIVFLGTRSHLEDFALLAPELERFLRAHPEAQLDTFLGRWAPAELRELPNAIHHAPLHWPAFRRLLQRRRWHLALAPMRPTAVNRARSWNKLLDHAAAGTATLATEGACPALDVALGSGRYGLPLPASPARWREALEWLLHDREQAARLAAAGAERASHIADPQSVRTFWSHLLAPPRQKCDTHVHRTSFPPARHRPCTALMQSSRVV